MSAAVQESSLTIGTATAVALASNGLVGNGLLGRAGIIVFNAGGGGNVYLGGPNVSIGTGIALASNASPITINTPSGAAVYGIASLAGTVVRIIEF